MSNTISRHDIEYAMDNADLPCGKGTVNDTYSPWHANGETCLSITFEGKRIQRNLCRFFVELGIAAGETRSNVAPDVAAVTRLADEVCTDDLGLDMIVYFPGWKLSD